MIYIIITRIFSIIHRNPAPRCLLFEGQQRHGQNYQSRAAPHRSIRSGLRGGDSDRIIQYATGRVSGGLLKINQAHNFTGDNQQISFATWKRSISVQVSKLDDQLRRSVVNLFSYQRILPSEFSRFFRY